MRMDDQSQQPPQRGDYIPPQPQQPPYQVTADIPPTSPYHQSPQPGSSNRQAAGWLTGVLAALAAVFKYGGLLLLKVPALGSLVTVLISFGVYALFLGPWAALGIVIMLAVHELGHVVEIRRQGLRTSAVVFVPFMGAATLWRNPTLDPIKRAEIAIAGPVAGTVGAVVAFALYGSTGSPVFLYWAYVGFFLNLLNLIPFGMLDGGAILAPASKWFQVFGLVALGGLLFTGSVSPIAIVIVVLGLPSLFERFRNAALDTYLTAGPATTRYALAGVWLALVGFLSYAMLTTQGMLAGFVR